MKRPNRRQSQGSPGYPAEPPVAESRESHADIVDIAVRPRAAAPKISSPAARHRGYPSRDDISVAAFLIYLSEGCLPGREVQHWCQAEAQLAAIPLTALQAEIGLDHAG